MIKSLFAYTVLSLIVASPLTAAEDSVRSPEMVTDELVQFLYQGNVDGLTSSIFDNFKGMPSTSLYQVNNGIKQALELYGSPVDHEIVGTEVISSKVRVINVVIHQEKCPHSGDLSCTNAMVNGSQSIFPSKTVCCGLPSSTNKI